MRLLAHVAIVLLVSPALFGQLVELRGVITDESGAIVPGAKVTITGTAGAPKDAVAANDGSYSFANIAAGSYTVRALAPDLASVAAKIDLKPGIQTLNLQLKIVTASQQVTVEDRAVTVTPEPANNAS